MKKIFKVELSQNDADSFLLITITEIELSLEARSKTIVKQYNNAPEALQAVSEIFAKFDKSFDVAKIEEKFAALSDAQKLSLEQTFDQLSPKHETKK